MKRCVFLVRCSTEKEKGLQDYQYQIDTLSEICKKRDWEIVKVFGNYVSGVKPIEERPEIQDLIAYVKENKIDYCCATSIDRVSRDLLTGVQIIRSLAEQGVNLYLANYNIFTLDENSRISVMSELMLSVTLSVASYEREQIRTRLNMGYQSYLQRRREDKDAHPLGRPVGYAKGEEEYRRCYPKELSLLRKGYSIRNIAAITGTSRNTIMKLKRFV